MGDTGRGKQIEMDGTSGRAGGGGGDQQKTGEFTVSRSLKARLYWRGLNRPVRRCVSWNRGRM